MTDVRLTANFTQEEAEWIEEVAEEHEISKSKAVRRLVERGYSDVPELEDRIDDLEDRLEDREQRVKELEDQLRRRSQIEDRAEEINEKVDVLANRVEVDDQPNPPFIVRWWQWWRER